MYQTDTKGLEGSRVRVYYNLRKKCFSIKFKGLVKAHVDSVNLTDVKFIVSEAGRQRVLREKQKNVHAYVEGVVVAEPVTHGGRLITYNPYFVDSFIDKKSKDPIENADACFMTGKEIWV